MSGLIGSDFVFGEMIGCGEDYKIFRGLPSVKFCLKVFDKTPKTPRGKNVGEEAEGEESDKMEDSWSILQEKEILEKIDCHPYFARHFFLMELMSGRCLKTLLEDGPLGNRFAIFSMAEVVLSLEYLHSMNLAHRSLRPENISFTKERRLKISDTESTICVEGTIPVSGRTPTKESFSEDQFIAPEVFSSKSKVTCQSDLWSLGVLLFFTLTGKLPFENKYSLQHKIICFPETFANESARDLISRLLEYDKNKRISLPEVKDHLFFSSVDFDKIGSFPIPLFRCDIPDPKSYVDEYQKNHITKSEDDNLDRWKFLKFQLALKFGVLHRVKEGFHVLKKEEKMMGFLEACKRGYIDIVTYLAEKMWNVLDVDYRNDDDDGGGGRTALMLACVNEHTEIVKYLCLELGASLDVEDRNLKRSALLMAVFGSICVDEDEDNDENNIWSEARVEIIKFLISNGAKLRSSTGENVLTYILRSRRNWDVCELVLDRGADFTGSMNSLHNLDSFLLSRPLHAVISHIPGDFGIELLKYFIDRKKWDFENDEKLLYFVVGRLDKDLQFEWRLRVVKFLVSRGANVFAVRMAIGGLTYILDRIFSLQQVEYIDATMEMIEALVCSHKNVLDGPMLKSVMDDLTKSHALRSTKVSSFNAVLKLLLEKGVIRDPVEALDSFSLALFRLVGEWVRKFNREFLESSDYVQIVECVKLLVENGANFYVSGYIDEYITPKYPALELTKQILDEEEEENTEIYKIWKELYDFLFLTKGKIEDLRKTFLEGCRGGNLSLVRECVGKDRRCLYTEKERTGLRIAKENGHVDIKEYLEGLKMTETEILHFVGEESAPIFFKACEDGELDTVKDCVEEKGIDPVHVFERGKRLRKGKTGELNIQFSALHKVCMALRKHSTEEKKKLGLLEIVKYLVEECGVSVDVLDHPEFGYPPILYITSVFLTEKSDPKFGNFFLADEYDMSVFRYFVVERKCKLHFTWKNGAFSMLSHLCRSISHEKERFQFRRARMEMVKMLVEDRRCKVDFEIDDETPLRNAVERCELDVVKYLVETGGGDVNFGKCPPLIGATGNWRFLGVKEMIEVTTYLIDKGARLDAVGPGGRTFLMGLVENIFLVGKLIGSERYDLDNKRMIKFVESVIGQHGKNIGMNILDHSNRTALVLAIKEGKPQSHFQGGEMKGRVRVSRRRRLQGRRRKRGREPVFVHKIIKLLVENGADLEIGGGNLLGVRTTALMRVATFRYGNSDDIIKTLVSCGANLESADEMGRTALFYSLGGKFELENMKILLEIGANVDHQDRDGNTILTWSTPEGFCELLVLGRRFAEHKIAKFLLDSYNPNIFIRNNQGKSAYEMYEMSYGTEETRLLFTRYVEEIVKLNKSFREACKTGDLELIKDLFALNSKRRDARFLYVDVAGKDHGYYRNGISICLEEGGSFEVLKFLVAECKMDPQVPDEVDDKNYPMHVACRVGSLEIVQYLMESCVCDPNVLNGSKKTPLMISIESGKVDIAKHLIGTRAAKKTLHSNGEDSETALMKSVRMRNLELVNLLIDHGVDLDAENSNDETAYDIAVQLEEKNIAIALASGEAVQSAKKRGRELEVLRKMTQFLEKQKAENQKRVQELLDKHAKRFRIPPSKLKVLRKKKLGSGGFGAVFRGIQTIGEGVEKKVAVKIVGYGGTDSSDLESVFEEFKRSMEFQHKNVVETIGFDDSVVNEIRIVMELMDGSIAEYIQRNVLSLEQKFEVMKLMTKGLMYLHDLKPKFIHRDVKGANFLYTQDIESGELHSVKICDFGLTKTVEDGESDKTLRSAKGQGTKLWMAPEAMDGVYSVKSDVYSLGISFWEVLFEQIPFREYNHNEIPYLVRRRGLRPNLELHNNMLPKKLKKLLARCWDVDRENRPSTRDLVQWFECNEDFWEDSDDEDEGEIESQSDDDSDGDTSLAGYFPPKKVQKKRMTNLKKEMKKGK